ncbi:MAG TPA: hypothetical protein VLG47_03310 [Candidatus Saccharimonadales bacterium]|nr:hypothetical protein [Candidatus Saccharimonadales bacterium]
MSIEAVVVNNYFGPQVVETCIHAQSIDLAVDALHASVADFHRLANGSPVFTLSEGFVMGAPVSYLDKAFYEIRSNKARFLASTLDEYDVEHDPDRIIVTGPDSLHYESIMMGLGQLARSALFGHKGKLKKYLSKVAHLPAVTEAEYQKYLQTDDRSSACVIEMSY